MSKRRKIILLVLVGYVLGLAWGYVRLPFAAVKSLADYRLLADKPHAFASDEHLQMSGIQRWYLKRSIKLEHGTETPQISAAVQWNCGIVARVKSGHYVSPTGAEWL